MVSPAPGWWCGDRTYPYNKDDYLFKFWFHMEKTKHVNKENLSKEKIFFCFVI